MNYFMNINQFLNRKWIWKVNSFTNLMKVVVILVLFLFSIPLFSHTIVFKDLQVLKGIVYKQDDSYIYFKTENGNKDVKVRKDAIGTIVIQDIKDDSVLKKLLKKVKDKFPNYKQPAKDSPSKDSPPQEDLADVEIQNINSLLVEIEEDEKLNTIKLKRRDALFKSFLFPGLGHFELERKAPGYFYAGTFLAFTLGAIYQNQKMNEEFSKYEKSVSTNLYLSFLYNPNFIESKAINSYLLSYQLDRAAFQNFENAEGIRNQIAAGAVAVYLIQIVHTYLIGKTSEMEIDKRKTSLNIYTSRESFFGNEGFFAKIQYTIVY